MEMMTSPRPGFCSGALGMVDAAQVTMDSIPTSPSPPSGPMTRARAKALHDKVNSLLSSLDLGSTLDGLLLHTDTLCILRYESRELPQHLPRSVQGTADEATPSWSKDPGVSALEDRSLRPAYSGVSGRDSAQDSGLPKMLSGIDPGVSPGVYPGVFGHPGVSALRTPETPA